MGKTTDGQTSVLLHLHYVFNRQSGSLTMLCCLAAASKMEMMVSMRMKTPETQEIGSSASGRGYRGCVQALKGWQCVIML